MNGHTLTLGLVGALALAGAVQRRGSRATDDQTRGLGPAIREAKNDAKRFKNMIARLGEWTHDLHDVSQKIDALFGNRVIGVGAHRLVLSFAENPSIVIKIAHYTSVNVDEAEFWKDAGPKTRKMLVPVLAVAPDGAWIIMERVQPREWEEEPSPQMVALIQRAEAVGLLDIREENTSICGRILDYGEPIVSKGTPNQNRRTGRGTR